MNIIHLIPSLIKGGAQRLAVDICREINTRKEHNVLLVLLEDSNEYSHLTQNLIISKTSSSVKLSFFKKGRTNLQDFENIIAEFKPDIIHSHLFAAEIFSREKTYPGIKYFTHCHDNMYQFRNFSKQTIFSKNLLADFYEKQHLLKAYIKCNNEFLAISKHNKDYFESVLPTKLNRNITLLHNAIDFKKFNAANRQRNFDKIRIINVGSFTLKKNQKFFIAIAEELKKRKLTAEIVLLGSGKLYNELKDLISARNLTDFFSMPGNIDYVEDYYAKANIYVHTATYEPFGLVLLEAMAAGLPIISLDGGGNQDLIIDNQNGFMIKVQNEQLFTDKIELLFNNRNLYSKFSEGANKFAQQFDISAYVDSLLKIYGRTL